MPRHHHLFALSGGAAPSLAQLGSNVTSKRARTTANSAGRGTMRLRRRSPVSPRGLATREVPKDTARTQQAGVHTHESDERQVHGCVRSMRPSLLLCCLPPRPRKWPNKRNLAALEVRTGVGLSGCCLFTLAVAASGLAWLAAGDAWRDLRPHPIRVGRQNCVSQLGETGGGGRRN